MSSRKRVGLALGGGVVRGLAHVGVLSVLVEAGIPIDFVAGSSAGSLIGASFCSGLSVETIQQQSYDLRWWHLARPAWPAQGFLSFERMECWVIKNVGDLQIEQLNIPFTALATDLDTGEVVRLQHGRLAPALRASCSVPGFVAPVVIDGRILGDGSLANSLPVDVLRDMGADYVIGVDILSSAIRPRWGAVGMGLNALEILVQRAGGGIDDADCLLVPDLSGETYLRFSKRERLFRLGAQAARENITAIQAALS